VFTRTDAIRIASEFLAQVPRRDRICGAYLFGSTVWGQPGPYSDIDLVVLVEPAAGSDGVDATEAFDLFHAAQELNSALEVICYTPEEFREGSGTLVRRIRERGLAVPLPSGAPVPHAAVPA
jgi:predicted nucleotidyltransferase